VRDRAPRTRAATGARLVPTGAEAGVAGVAAQLLHLQRAAGNRAVNAALNSAPRGAGRSVLPTVQRAILAIDGASDDDTSKAITRSALANLMQRKRIRTADAGDRVATDFPAGDARGSVYGPGVAGASLAALGSGVRAGGVDPDEALYVLGHGSGVTVADLDAEDLATALAQAFAAFPGAATYRGAVKLVACYSASMKSDGRPITRPDGTPIPKPYGATLAAALARRSSRSFRPSRVDGVAGIAWVDELSGAKTGFDVTGERQQNPLEDVYEDPALVQQWFAAMQEPDATLRRRAMDAVLEEAHRRRGMTGPTRITGKQARRRYWVR